MSASTYIKSREGPAYFLREDWQQPRGAGVIVLAKNSLNHPVDDGALYVCAFIKAAFVIRNPLLCEFSKLNPFIISKDCAAATWAAKAVGKSAPKLAVSNEYKRSKAVNESGIAAESLNFSKYERYRERVTSIRRIQKLDSMLARLFGVHISI